MIKNSGLTINICKYLSTKRNKPEFFWKVSTKRKLYEKFKMQIKNKEEATTWATPLADSNDNDPERRHPVSVHSKKVVGRFSSLEQRKIFLFERVHEDSRNNKGISSFSSGEFKKRTILFEPGSARADSCLGRLCQQLLLTSAVWYRHRCCCGATMPPSAPLPPTTAAAPTTVLWWTDAEYTLLERKLDDGETAGTLQLAFNQCGYLGNFFPHFKS